MESKRIAQIGRATWPDSERALARESALHLLERSIEFGHGRLAVLRLGVAVQARAEPAPWQWLYCSDVALESGATASKPMFDQSSELAGYPRHRAISIR